MIYGQRPERSWRPIEPLALTFEGLESDATEDERAPERAVAKTTKVRGFTRKLGDHRTFPMVIPTSCPEAPWCRAVVPL